MEVLSVPRRFGDTNISFFHADCWVRSFYRENIIDAELLKALHIEDRDVVKWTQEYEFSHGAYQARLGHRRVEPTRRCVTK